MTPGIAQPDIAHLGELARQLRALHRIGTPLVLVNAWDVASAKQIEQAGCAAVATSSAACAAVLGMPDDNTMAPEVALGVFGRIARQVSVPVTVDFEGGYNLSADELVDGLLNAGVVGCNIEDSDYTGAGVLVDPDVHARRLGDIRGAALASGVDLVVNARIDTFIRYPERSIDQSMPDTIRRARAYLDAGADCVYPIRLTEPALVAELVEALDAPVNANIDPTVGIDALAKAGAARISVGPAALSAVMRDLRRRTEFLLGGDIGGFLA
jgi:2-methylisocitrate lyase-like PEP mutase family enzyme